MWSVESTEQGQIENAGTRKTSEVCKHIICMCSFE